MKVWFGHGSDHSANLVMIGEFKTEQDAERVATLIETISERASADYADGIVDHWKMNEQISESTEARLRDLKIHNLSPADIADFALLNTSPKRVGRTLQFRTDDDEIGGFVKLMVAYGARVEVYSAHVYPIAEDE